MSNRNLIVMSDFIPIPQWSRENQEDFIGFLEADHKDLEYAHHSLYRVARNHAAGGDKEKVEAIAQRLGSVLVDLFALIMEEKIKLHRMPEEE